MEGRISCENHWDHIPRLPRSGAIGAWKEDQIQRGVKGVEVIQGLLFVKDLLVMEIILKGEKSHILNSMKEDLPTYGHPTHEVKTKKEMLIIK